MIANKAHSLRPARRISVLPALAVALVAALGGAAGSSPAIAQGVTASVQDPGKQLPGAVHVTGVDFKRGAGGSGKLVLRFDGTGAAPDMRNLGNSVIVDLANASLPPQYQRQMDVRDFATPVQSIGTRMGDKGTTLVLATSGVYDAMAYQTGNEYIVEVVPRATAAASATGAARTPVTVGGDTAPVYRGKPVTFNFQDIPVRTVLQLIAEESGLNIVAADTVSGNVTLRLTNVPWDQALDIILQAKGLDKRRSGNVVWVAPQPEIAKYEQDKANARVALEQSEPTVTEMIPISYGNAEDIAKLFTDESKNATAGGAGGGAGAAAQLNRGFLSPRGSISFDRRTNTLLVIDIPQRVSEIKRLVSELDKPVDQVLIEARIVIATESFARDLGARFGISGYRAQPGGSLTTYGGNLEGNLATNNSVVSSLTSTAVPPPNITITRGLNVNLPVTNPAGSLAFTILNAGHMLDVELSALQQEGRGEVISNPRVVTSNQKEAVISQGKEVGYVTISPQQGGNNTPIPNVQFKDVLLELRVTPTITADGRVFLNMAVKKDEIDSFVNTSIGSVPQINKRSVNTAVLVNDGQTVVIGGVYEFTDRNDVTKVPFLGDLPFLGNLFRQKSKTKEKAELLIFVTPKVIRVARSN
jgi:type IV pilus assembly protein PilQ